ncbi:hypothetical protein DYB28_009813 [Aphanomyces astaci]|uniref:Uncharacterized protein n=1 Tax=Aphanomyces astaci TaxID=112090 RepID=A0A9X8DQ07_APHAT|nr:hypothetical protein DYB28_009813 [Aphanomyces astaci]
MEVSDPRIVSHPLLSLTVVKILMRDRDSIDVFLSVEAFELFVRVAEQATDEAAACEAIKCAINSVYKRPSFVADLLATQTTYDTLFHLTSTLAFCVQSPHSLPHDGDRVALATELLKVLYVFASAWQLTKHAANVLLLVQHPALVDRFICYDGVGHTIALLEYVVLNFST